MKEEQKELFRKALLQVLDANRTRFGLTVTAMGLHLGAFGFSVTNFPTIGEFHGAIEEELGYLEGKGFVEEALKVISKENRAWRITRAGIAFIDSGA